MKCIFSINMYSGLEPPQCELTFPQIKKISELVSRLHVPYKSIYRIEGLSALSRDSYSVFWLDERCVGNPDFIFDPFEGPWMGVQCRPGAPVHVWRKEENFMGADLKDTVGLWEYLSTIGCPLLAKHFRDAEEAKEEYYEKVLGISAEKKV